MDCWSKGDTLTGEGWTVGVTWGGKGDTLTGEGWTVGVTWGGKGDTLKGGKVGLLE